MIRRILISIAAFSLFGCAGPVIRTVFRPALQTGDSRQRMTNLVMLVWPTSLLGAGPPGDAPTELTLAIENVVLFAVFGLLLALIARRLWVILTAYLAMCLLLVSIERWGSGYALAYFSC